MELHSLLDSSFPQLRYSLFWSVFGVMDVFLEIPSQIRKDPYHPYHSRHPRRRHHARRPANLVHTMCGAWFINQEEKSCWPNKLHFKNVVV